MYLASTVAKNHGERIFPLPVTAMERMFLVDDCRDYPMVSSMELCFSGRLNREAFQDSLETSIARHPLLASRIVDDGKRGAVWVPADRAPEIDWNSFETSVHGTRKYIDLRSNVGLKLWVRQGDESTRIVFCVHHACCDGCGVLQFCEDLFAGYCQALGIDLSLRELDADLLRERGRFRSPAINWRNKIGELKKDFAGAYDFFMRAPTPLATAGNGSAHWNGHEGLVNHTLESQLLQGLRRAAARQQTTVNDIMLRDLFLVLRDWNCRRGAGRRRQWLSIMMPCDLREPEQQHMPAANRMSYAFLTRSPDDCRHPEELLQGIRAQTADIRDENRSLTWIRGVEAAQASRFGEFLMSRWRRCFCTAVLSSLGDPARSFVPRFPRQRGKLELGNLVLDDIVAYTPLRAKTHASFLTTMYAGQLTVGATCDPHAMAPAAAEELVKRFGEQLADSATAG